MQICVIFLFAIHARQLQLHSQYLEFLWPPCLVGLYINKTM